jgi:hypothetical protein
MSYVQVFVGIPLSQFSFKNKPVKTQNFINELSALIEEELSIGRVDPYLENVQDEDVRAFLKACVLDVEELRNNNIDFHRDYHGGNDFPMIFGKYMDDVFEIPRYEIGEFNTDISKLIEESHKFEKIVKKILPEHIFKALKEEKLIGIFFNNHSS